MVRPAAEPRRKTARVIELEWTDPPPEVPKIVQPYLEVLLDLQNKPEHWGRIATYAAVSGAGSAEKRLARAMPDLDFGIYEFTARSSSEGSELYARWMGAS